MRKWLLPVFFFLILCLPAPLSASYATVVIPLRAREYWQDFAKPKLLLDYLKKENLPATVLLTYAGLEDREVTAYLEESPNFELGIFLEVDEKLATDSLVSYNFGNFDRAQANQILFSGYPIEGRIRMIDRIMAQFNKVFGFKPESAGSWYIDGISIKYLAEKFEIKNLMDVADQFETDTYGVWGKPWGVPYFPSKYNPLLPADSGEESLGLVTIQWAARDPLRGYGLTADSSTYSLQANDYLSHHKLGTAYFSHLLTSYLDGENSARQVTVGLEAGQEGASFFGEFQKQVADLKKRQQENNLFFTSMSEYGNIFRKANPQFSEVTEIHASDYSDKTKEGWWFNFPAYRVYFELSEGKLAIRDLRLYRPFLFNDMVQADRQPVLKRIIPGCIDDLSENNAMRISDNIEKISLKKEAGNFILEPERKGRLKDKIIIRPDSISFNSREIFQTGSQSVPLAKNFFYDIYLDYQTGKKSVLKPSIVYSQLAAVKYLGLAVNSGRFIGFKSAYPYFGSVSFPFQVLSKFKGMSLNKFIDVFLTNLVNSNIHCKINSRL